jgi:hypothetical protein
MRITEPESLTVNGTEMQLEKPKPPRITICGEDGRELLAITVTEDGRLDVSGPEGAWTEGAARFVAEVRRMTGAA